MMERVGREGKCSFTSRFFYMLCNLCVSILGLECPLLKVPCHPHVVCRSNYYDYLASRPELFAVRHY